MKNFKIYIVGLLICLSGCKEPYTIDTTSVNSNILVVDGFINSGNDSTFINLSRTVTLANKKTLNPELGATVTVETSTNESRVLTDKGKGVYATSPLNFGVNKKYRLKIKTKNGTNYLSDFVESLDAPQIDSVNFQVKPDGLQLYVNASDPANKTHYYRWEYEETWIFYSKYYASAIWRGGPIADSRLLEESVNKCWGNANSSTILIGSSIKLNKDVIHLSPLTDITSGSEKLSEKYSILVKQYALTKDAYGFWQALKKNTESLGSIFDVLPTQLTGNIRNTTNVTEPVIGYISAGSTQKKRIYITKDKLPKWEVIYPYGCALPDSVLFADQRSAFSTGNYTPIAKYTNLQGDEIGHTAAARVCTDCTIRGTVKKPSFWQ